MKEQRVSHEIYVVDVCLLLMKMIDGRLGAEEIQKGGLLSSRYETPRGVCK